MAEDKKTFRETRIYPVFFMILITVIFVGVLATFYHLTQKRVKTHKTQALKTIVLNLFDLSTDNLSFSYNKYISELEKEITFNGEIQTFKYYEARDDEKMLGYVFPISGSGLWSTINAMLAVTSDLKQIINLEIVNQNETPGLGGRISEDWFKKQFTDKQLVQGNTISLFSIIPEKDKATANEINQITGATASSKAVVDMLYKDMIKISKALDINYE